MSHAEQQSFPSRARHRRQPRGCKAITYAELYGHADPLTQEWTDGVLAIVLRDVAEAAEARATDTATAHWVVVRLPFKAWGCGACLCHGSPGHGRARIPLLSRVVQTQPAGVRRAG